ncbi:hypothetical protein J2X82_000080 [Priestia megaterium]|jgi:hypothetical protein|nr:hypothetical protein [Priestia megaterium]
MNRSDFFIVMVNAGLLHVAMSQYFFIKKI